ncbi:MAG: nicotinic acid mononucleotide adenylyltransferase, partial [bacterium]
MPKPSYTIDTLTWLSDKHKNREFVMICGSDVFPTFHRWKNYEVLLDQYKIYVYPRPGFDLGEYRDHPSVELFQAPHMEISSSFIRKAIGDGKNLDFWMPEKVYKYIQEMHFYE